MPFTRRRLLVRAARASGALVVASAATGRGAPAARAAAPTAPAPVARLGAPPLRDADYLALAERIMRRFHRTWDEERRAYGSGARGTDVIHNAALLTVHAVAAQHGHEGRARNDDRARLLVDRLCAAPPFFEGRRLPHPDVMFHTPGWVANLDSLAGAMDKAIDPKVAEGLVSAWRARDVLGLAPDTVARIADRIDRVARARFFRYPHVRLNQINWNAELYAYAALVTGDPELLRADYRRHVRRFVAGVRRPLRPGHTTNLGPSYRFHYQPDYPPSPRNFDSAEYANVTLHFLHFYEQALQAGMRPLPEEDMAILRAWVQRALYGYWLHSGMLNWDTGLGFERWMKSKTWAYAQQGLLAIARARRFHDDPREAEWAKHLFDRGLVLYERLLDAAPRRWLPSAHLYSVGAAHQGMGSERMFSSRVAANAARAVAMGLGSQEGGEPPAFYAFDADIGRLAVSTRRYGTAIVASGRRALPYGGIELARLFDPSGEPVGGVGGRPPAAFGIVVRGAGGRRLVASQSPRGDSPGLVLARSPRGRVDRLRRLPRDPDAGPFAELEAVGQAGGRHALVTTRHRFTPRFVETAWTVERRSGRRSLTVDALFPSWGRAARIEAVRRDGSAAALVPGGGDVALADVAYFFLAGPRGGYVVVCLDDGAARARALRVRPQKSAPRAGPSLAVQLARGPGFRRAGLRVRIAPAVDAGRARVVAARLRRGR